MAVWCVLNMISDGMSVGILVTRNMISDLAQRYSMFLRSLTATNYIRRDARRNTGHKEYDVRCDTAWITGHEAVKGTLGGGGVNDLKREASLFTRDDTGIVLFFIGRNLLFCITRRKWRKIVTVSAVAS